MSQSRAQLLESKDLNSTEMERMRETIIKQEEEINKLKETHSNTPELVCDNVLFQPKNTSKHIAEYLQSYTEK